MCESTCADNISQTEIRRSREKNEGEAWRFREAPGRDKRLWPIVPGTWGGSPGLQRPPLTGGEASLSNSSTRGTAPDAWVSRDRRW